LESDNSTRIHATFLRDFLQPHLDSTWQLYLQPFFNGDHPHLAAFHPIHGLTLFGVFPWDLRRYRSEQRGRYRRYFQRTETGARPIHSPVRRVEHLIENLVNLYLPYIGESIGRDRRSLQAFQVVLYFPHATTYAAQTFAPMAPGRGSIFGYDTMENADMATILPASQRPINRAMPREWLDDLRFWLAPSPHLPSGADALQLTEEQRRHIQPAPGQHQRLHGVAGSGKTLVIAQRAANLAAAGKRVLVITFNVTLWQYIRTLVNRTAVEFVWQNIEFHHFHGFCKNFLTENGIEWPRPTGRSSKHALDEIVPTLVRATVESFHQTGKTMSRRYDAILIDEGQDFPRSYYDTLCYFLTENDEILFVADRKQNLYLRDDSWLDKMSGTKFRGRWREMKQSYRLSPAIAQAANHFADQFLTKRVADTASVTAGAIESTRPLVNSHLSWHNKESLAEIIAMIRQLVPWLLGIHTLKPADIVILTPNQQDGWMIANALDAEGFAVNHTLSADEGKIGRKQRRFRKRTFAPEDERLKVSTIHGFKGWELHTVIVITPPNEQFWEMQSPYLFYVAMTRARHNLIVFNRYPAYNAYGATWNELSYDPTTPQLPSASTNSITHTTSLAGGVQPRNLSDQKDN